MTKNTEMADEGMMARLSCLGNAGWFRRGPAGRCQPERQHDSEAEQAIGQREDPGGKVIEKSNRCAQ